MPKTCVDCGTFVSTRTDDMTEEGETFYQDFQQLRCESCDRDSGSS